MFSKDARVEADFNMQGSTIRYTKDGGDVLETSLAYSKPISVTNSSKYRFKAFHPEFKESSEILVNLIKIGHNVSDAKITLSTEPHPNYSGKGASALVDLKKGTTQFRDGKQWLGFKDDELRVQMDFKKDISISNISISTLKDHGSWIFLPVSVQIISDNKMVGETTLNAPVNNEPKQLEFIEIPISKNSYKNIEIRIELMEEIPEWHQGKGTKPFFFIDEILVE